MSQKLKQKNQGKDRDIFLCEKISVYGWNHTRDLCVSTPTPPPPQPSLNYQFRQIFFVDLLVDVELDLGVVGVQADGALTREAVGQIRVTRSWKKRAIIFLQLSRQDDI